MREKLIFHPVANTKTIQFLVFDEGYYYYVEFTPEFDIMNWHHYAATYNTKVIKLYIDGKLVANAINRREPAIAKDGDLFIGCDSKYPNRYFHGAIDEIRMWDYEKSEKEIQNWMNYELYGNEKGLFFYLDFNKGAPNKDNRNDTAIVDLSNSIAGYLHNFELNNEESNWVQSGVRIKGKAKEYFFLLRYLNTQNIIVFFSSLAFIIVLLFARIQYQKRISRKLSLEVIKRTKELSVENKIKDALIAEIHHRVKNNLQTISGLIYFQMSELNSDNEKQALKSIQNRVLSIAAIHEKLYSHEYMTKTNLKEMILELVGSIQNLVESNGNIIKAEIEIDNIEIGITSAITIGQLVSESIRDN